MGTGACCTTPHTRRPAADRTCLKNTHSPLVVKGALLQGAVKDFCTAERTKPQHRFEVWCLQVHPLKEAACTTTALVGHVRHRTMMPWFVAFQRERMQVGNCRAACRPTNMAQSTQRVSDADGHYNTPPCCTALYLIAGPPTWCKVPKGAQARVGLLKLLVNGEPKVTELHLVVRVHHNVLELQAAKQCQWANQQYFQRTKNTPNTQEFMHHVSHR